MREIQPKSIFDACLPKAAMLALRIEGFQGVAGDAAFVEMAVY